MTGAYIDKDYVYAVARVRGEELKLLSNQALSELISAKDTSVIKRMLKEKGFGGDSDEDFLMMIKKEIDKLWEFINDVVPDKSVLSVFYLENDFHNLKAAIKESTMEYQYEGIYIDVSSVDVSLIKECIKNKTYDNLPSFMVDIAREAHETFLRTNDGQICDVMIDKACMEEILRVSKESKDETIKLYAELMVASSNIKIAVRAVLTKKTKEWMESAIAECDSLDKSMLINATLNGIDSLCNFIQSTEYSDAALMIKKSLTALEKWCDDVIIIRMREMLYESFGLGPIIAYILAKIYEIKSVFVIYTAIRSRFSEEVIRERIRETYV